MVLNVVVIGIIKLHSYVLFSIYLCFLKICVFFLTKTIPYVFIPNPMQADNRVINRKKEMAEYSLHFQILEKVVLNVGIEILCGLT